MKAFVFASAFTALVAVVTHVTAATPELEKFRKECVVESKVDEAKITQIRKDHIFIDDEGLQKYMFCVLSKEGVVDAEGNLIRAVAEKMAQTKEDKEKDALAFDTCLNQKGTPLQKVYLMSECYVGIRPDVDFL